MKKKILIIAIILTVLGFHLSLRYLVNELYIIKYDEEKYDNKLLGLLKIINIPESYIVYFNEGNYYYQEEEYDEAILSYEKALKSVRKDRVCDVRHNLALTRLQTLDYDNNKNLKYELEEIQEVLLENNCATDDNDGDHDPSQELYNEIEKVIKAQGKKDDGDDGKDGDDGDKDKDNNNTVSEKKEKEIENQLREQQKNATSERQKINRSNYDYYKGKSW